VATAFVTEAGTDDPEEIAMLDGRSHVKGVCERIREASHAVTQLHEVRLIGLFHWIKATKAMTPEGEVVDLSKYDDDAQKRHLQLSQVETAASGKYSTESTSVKDTIIKKPPKLEEDMQWPDFEDTLTNCLASKTSSDGYTPLNYLIREDVETADSSKQSATEFQRKVETKMLYGSDYEKDNGKLSSLMLELTEKTPYEEDTKKSLKTRDGRSAHMSVRHSAMGEGPTNRFVTAAYTGIENAVCKGEGPRWTFAKYRQVLRAHYRTLEKYNEPQPETKKVRDVMNGLQPEVLLRS